MGPFPEPKLSGKTGKSLYSVIPHAFRRKHIEMKMDFLPELITRSISNPDLSSLIEKVEILFNKKIKNINKKHYELNYRDAEEIYKNNEDLQNLMKEMKEVLQGSTVRDCIEVSAILSNDLFYFIDLLPEANLWDVIEDQLNFNLHILTFEEKAKAYYGLTHKFPKKCSFQLRQRLVESLLKTNFEGISIKSMLMFSFATRNESARDFCHYKFYENLLNFSWKINEAPLDSSLPLDALYSFFNNRISPGKRKKLRFIDEEIEEEMNVLEHFSGAIRDRIPALSINGLFRLLSALSIARIKGYTDLAMKALRTVKKKINQIDPDVLVAILKLTSKFNYESGIGDKAFWEAIQVHVETNITQILETLDFQLKFELFRVLAVQNRLSQKLFSSVFEPLVEKYMSESQRDWECLYSISQIYTSAHLQNPKDFSPKFQNFIRSLLFSQKYWSYKQNYFFKMFRLLIELKKPEWDLSAMDYFGYHAEKEFDIWKLKKSSMTPELKQIVSISQTNLEMRLLPLVEFKQSFLVDLANTDFKFAIFIKSNSNTLSSQRKLFDLNSNSADFVFFKRLQKEILKADNWHIYELDFEEFLSQKDNRVEWLQEELQREFGKAVEKRPDPYSEFREEILEYLYDKRFEEYATPLNAYEKLTYRKYKDYIKHYNEHPEEYQVDYSEDYED